VTPPYISIVAASKLLNADRLVRSKASNFNFQNRGEKFKTWKKGWARGAAAPLYLRAIEVPCTYTLSGGARSRRRELNRVALAI